MSYKELNQVTNKFTTAVESFFHLLYQQSFQHYPQSYPQGTTTSPKVISRRFSIGSGKSLWKSGDKVVDNVVVLETLKGRVGNLVSYQALDNSFPTSISQSQQVAKAVIPRKRPALSTIHYKDLI